MTKARRAALLALVASAALLAAVVQTGPAEARDQGNIGTISPSNPKLEKSYPGIPGVYPVTGAHPFSGFRPQGCSSYPYCDRITGKFEIPEDEYPGTWALIFTLKYNSQPPDQSDVDFFKWPDDDPALGAPETVCRSPTAADCEGKNPETHVQKEPEPGPMYFSVLNHRGVNLGYTLTIEYVFGELELPPLPADALKARERSRSGSAREEDDVSGTSAFRPAKAPAFELGTDAEEEKAPEVKVPGEDGSLVDQTLAVLTGQGTRGADGGINPIFPIAGAVVILGGGAGAFFFIRRRRRAAAEEAY